MKNKHIYLSALISGFGAGVLSVVPVFKNFACCLIIPAASYIALRLYKNSSGVSVEKLNLSDGLKVGFFTGTFSAFFNVLFDSFITFLTRKNDIVEAYYQIQQSDFEGILDDETFNYLMSNIGAMVSDITEKGFSLEYVLSMMFALLLLNGVFGIIGGLIGIKILKLPIDGRQ